MFMKHKTNGVKKKTALNEKNTIASQFNTKHTIHHLTNKHNNLIVLYGENYSNWLLVMLNKQYIKI